MGKQSETTHDDDAEAPAVSKPPWTPPTVSKFPMAIHTQDDAGGGPHDPDALNNSDDTYS
jgi:hypothetical protein